MSPAGPGYRKWMGDHAIALTSNIMNWLESGRRQGSRRNFFYGPAVSVDGNQCHLGPGI